MNPNLVLISRLFYNRNSKLGCQDRCYTLVSEVKVYNQIKLSGTLLKVDRLATGRRRNQLPVKRSCFVDSPNSVAGLGHTGPHQPSTIVLHAGGEPICSSWMACFVKNVQVFQLNEVWNEQEICLKLK